MLTLPTRHQLYGRSNLRQASWALLGSLTCRPRAALQGSTLPCKTLGGLWLPESRFQTHSSQWPADTQEDAWGWLRELKPDEVKYEGKAFVATQLENNEFFQLRRGDRILTYPLPPADQWDNYQWEKEKVPVTEWRWTSYGYGQSASAGPYAHSESGEP
eukprot:2568223-Amphidinium_carterae.1